jgi:AraC-like DNA-binding protein
MADIYAVPLQAIEAFEKTTGLAVSVHDLSGLLYHFLPHRMFQHNTPCCQAVKVDHDLACMAFDAERIRALMRERPDGIVKVCHAGLVEWVVPRLSDNGLNWVIFAGQRTPGKRFSSAIWDSTPRPKRAPWTKSTPLPPPVDDDEAQIILEMLRQLSTRLDAWRVELERSAGAPPRSRPGSPGERSDVLVTRRAAIKRLIDSRHRQPFRLSDLAALLHISESRAGHAVREACDSSFIELLVEARLKTAAGLLRHSNLSVIEVAERSGFGDLSHFHHAFRKHYRLTPHKYRRKFEQAI